MKVLQVIPELNAGGAERTTLEIAEALTAAGHEAVVASCGGRLEAELEHLGGRLVRMDAKTKNPITLRRNATRLASVIREQGVDLIHARSRAPAWSAFWAAKQTGIPYVTTYHGTYNARSALKRLYNSVMARGERVIANSEFIADHVRKEHAFAADRITIIPRGVDLRRYTPGEIPQDRLRAQSDTWALPDDGAIRLLLPARLTRWKGQEVAIDALAQLKTRDWATLPHLVLAGDDQGRHDYTQGLKNRIQQAGLQDHVHLVGHCSDMPAAIELCDIVLTPSIEPEAFGRTTAEAGAMKRPVIAANHGGAMEIIAQGETGLKVEPCNSDALAQGIADVITLGPAGRAQMGEKARARVARAYSTQALQAATLRVYEEVLKCRP